MSSFVAIDFETANEQRRSACSIGMVKFDSAGNAVAELTSLIHPHADCDYFLPRNTKIHGIDASQVVSAPSWEELAGQVYDFIGNAPLVAHNMAFDGYVLSDLAELYGLEPLPNRRLCTMRLARRILATELEHKRLSDVYKYYFPGESFEHHDASADARACGRIFARMLQDHTWQEIEELCPVPGTRRRSSASQVNRLASSELIERYVTHSDVLLGEHVCLTGSMRHGRRADIRALITALGGINEASLTPFTTILVVGAPNPWVASKNTPSAKLKKAQALRDKGSPIEILTEEQFFLRLSEDTEG